MSANGRYFRISKIFKVRSKRQRVRRCVVLAALPFGRSSKDSEDVQRIRKMFKGFKIFSKDSEDVQRIRKMFTNHHMRKLKIFAILEEIWSAVETTTRQNMCRLETTRRSLKYSKLKTWIQLIHPSFSNTTSFWGTVYNNQTWTVADVLNYWR